MRFKVGQIFQNTVDASMRAEVIEINDGGRAARLKSSTHDLGTFELNVGAVRNSDHKWHLVLSI
jgi:hypothetical protein